MTLWLGGSVCLRYQSSELQTNSLRCTAAVASWLVPVESVRDWQIATTDKRQLMFIQTVA